MSVWTESIIRARWLVAALGESTSPPWWRSQATSPAGIRFLERHFPRTALVASLETASRAASLVHDGPLARTGQCHLFRLPVADELAIKDWLGDLAGTQLLEQLAHLSPDQQLVDLRSLAGDLAVDRRQGPVHCGAVRTLRRRSTLERICAVYLAGFEANQPVYPYLDEAPA